MDPTKEKTIGCALWGGVTLIVIGLGLTMLFAMGGVFRGTFTRTPGTNEITDAGPLNWTGITLSVAALGVILAIGAVGYGLYYSKNAHVGTRRTVPNANIMGRYGYSREGVMLTADYEFEFADNPRYYVRMMTGPTETSEYECSPEVYFTCGEGMTGDAEVQGKWLGKFTPYIGRPS